MKISLLSTNKLQINMLDHPSSKEPKVKHMRQLKQALDLISAIMERFV